MNARNNCFALIVFMFIGLTQANAQLCAMLQNENNTFLNQASNLISLNKSLSSPEGKSLQKNFEAQLIRLDDIGSKFTDEVNICRVLKLKAYAGFASYLLKTKQYAELVALSEKTLTLVDDIRYDEYGLISCMGSGTVTARGFDEETEQYYNYQKEGMVTVNSFNRKDVRTVANMLYSNIAFAAYINNDIEIGERFFVKNFDNRYFYLLVGGFMEVVAHAILVDFDASQSANVAQFAAAAVYLKDHSKRTLNITRVAPDKDIAYHKAMDILRKDNQVKRYGKSNTVPYLSTPESRVDVYGLVLVGLVYDDINDKKDAVEMMKKYFIVEKKSGTPYFTPHEFAELFYHSKKNNNELTQAILKDNDPKFMSELAGRLLKHFKEYDTYNAGDIIYDIYLYYHQAGQLSKAKKAFMTIHPNKRGAYKEL